MKHSIRILLPFCAVSVLSIQGMQKRAHEAEPLERRALHSETNIPKIILGVKRTKAPQTEVCSSAGVAAETKEPSVSPVCVSDILDQQQRLFSGHAAALCGDTARLKHELEKSSLNIDSLDETGRSALHHAAERGSLEAVRILLEHGANPAEYSIVGYNALHFAVLSGNHDVVRCILLAQPTLINSIERLFGKTAAHLACFSSNFNVIETILHHEPDLNLQDCSGNTPVHLFMLRQNTGIFRESFIAVFELFCSADYDWSICNHDCNSPLHIYAHEVIKCRYDSGDRRLLDLKKVVALVHNDTTPDSSGRSWLEIIKKITQR